MEISLSNSCVLIALNLQDFHRFIGILYCNIVWRDDEIYVQPPGANGKHNHRIISIKQDVTIETTKKSDGL